MLLPRCRKAHTRLSLAIVAAGILGCAHEHTLESTKDLNDEELAALCADLEMRSNQECEWNMLERQSSVTDQQSWEINCRARRDSARLSFDNVCLDKRFPAADSDVP
jgi:hypothetical protein